MKSNDLLSAATKTNDDMVGLPYFFTLDKVNYIC